MSERTEVDLSRATSPAWLVKVPKYVSERWEKAGTSGTVGVLRIGKKIHNKPNVTFVMKKELAAMTTDEIVEKAPQEYKFQVLSNPDRVTMMFCESSSQQIKDPANSEPGDIKYDKLALAGKVIERFDCRPAGGEDYMKMKCKQIERAQQPTRITQQLDKRPVNAYKPTSNSNLVKSKKKREEFKKARLDKDHVKEILFNAFEKHQYYLFKDLVEITKQPTPYLKEILKEIGNHNMKGPHKHTWELKPEYRHYQGSSTMS